MDVTLRMFAQIQKEFRCIVGRAIEVIIQSAVVEQETYAVIGRVEFLGRYLQAGQCGITSEKLAVIVFKPDTISGTSLASIRFNWRVEVSRLAVVFST